MSSPHINRAILLTIGILPVCGVLFIVLPILGMFQNGHFEESHPVIIALSATINWALFFAYAGRYRKTECVTLGPTVLMIFVMIFLSMAIFLCEPGNLAIRICWGLFDVFKLILYIYFIKPENNYEFIATSAYYILQTFVCFVAKDIMLLASTLLGIWSLIIALIAVPIREPSYLSINEEEI